MGLGQLLFLALRSSASNDWAVVGLRGGVGGDGDGLC